MTPTHTFTLTTEITEVRAEPMMQTIHNIATVAAIHQGAYRKAVMQGASLAFIALEIMDMPAPIKGSLSEYIRDHVRNGGKVQDVIKIAQDQIKDKETWKELLRTFGKPLLRKLINFQL